MCSVGLEISTVVYDDLVLYEYGDKSMWLDWFRAY